MKEVKVTVLMPVYNCELYIKESIDSILNQTFSDFEFLIIDDASTDKTVELIKAYTDARIKLIEKPVNTGLTNSLNEGLKLAKGEYIARMDGDDISLPDRFKKQVTFLEVNQDVVVCGSWYSVIESSSVIIVPENYESIKLALLRGNCMAHPSIMMRKRILDNNSIIYNKLMEPAEDFDLWVRLAAIGKLHNLQEILLNYRMHNAQVSHKRKQQQIELVLKIRFQMLKYLKYSFNEDEYNLMKIIMSKNSAITLDDIRKYSILKDKMFLANVDGFFDYNGLQEYFNFLIKQSFKNYIVYRDRYHPLISYRYFAYRNEFELKLKLIDELKLIIKSIFFYKRKKNL